MDKLVTISPNPIVTTRTATSFSVNCRSLVLFENATFSVNLLDEESTIISVQFMTLTPEQYLEWGNDDTYIINLAAKLLGVTPLIS
jgi:hypothetical protein